MVTPSYEYYPILETFEKCEFELIIIVYPPACYERGSAWLPRRHRPRQVEREKAILLYCTLRHSSYVYRRLYVLAPRQRYDTSDRNSMNAWPISLESSATSSVEQPFCYGLHPCRHRNHGMLSLNLMPNHSNPRFHKKIWIPVYRIFPRILLLLIY